MILRIILTLGIFLLGMSDCSHETELRTQLLKDYDKTAKPSLQVKVTISITVLDFDMDEKLQALALDTWIPFEWEDPRLTWDAEKYPDIDKLDVDIDELWKPDVTLYNSVYSKNVLEFGNVKALVFASGKVMWIPPAHLKVACIMDMTYWPYDRHNCTAKFGSWVHSGASIDLVSKNDDFNFEPIAHNAEEVNLTRGEWHVIHSEVFRKGTVYDCCPEEYISILGNMLVQRVAPMYAWMIQMPVVVLCLLTMVVFLLPPSAGEKVLVGMLSLVLDLLFLFAVQNIIQNPTTHTPLIIELITKQLILTGANVIISSLLLRLVRDPHSSGLPRCCKIPVLVMSGCLCLSGYRQTVASSLVPMGRSMKGGEDLELNEGGGTRVLVPHDSRLGGDGDWLLLAAVVDRFCLIIFTIIFLINMITYYSIL